MAVLSGRGTYQLYELIEDHDQGFNDAVVNNQQNLAMHYLVEIINSLKERVDELEKTVAESKVSAPAKKTAKKATSAKKTTAKEEAPEEDDE